MTKASISLEDYQDYVAKRICDKFKLSKSELFALRAASKDGRMAPAYALFVRSRGLPIEVCLHSTRALRALGIRLSDFDCDPNSLEFTEVSDNELLQLRLAEFAGKIVAEKESFYRSQINILRKILASDDLKYWDFNVDNRDSGLRMLERFTQICFGWCSWHERSDYVEFVLGELKTRLSEIIPEEIRSESANWLVRELTDEVSAQDEINALPFSATHASSDVVESVRRMEGLTAILEIRDTERLMGDWLFKEELKQECTDLENWTEMPLMIRRVKRSLAKRISEIIPVDEFNEDEWPGHFDLKIEYPRRREESSEST